MSIQTHSVAFNSVSSILHSQTPVHRGHGMNSSKSLAPVTTWASRPGAGRSLRFDRRDRRLRRVRRGSRDRWASQRDRSRGRLFPGAFHCRYRGVPGGQCRVNYHAYRRLQTGPMYRWVRGAVTRRRRPRRRDRWSRQLPPHQRSRRDRRMCPSAVGWLAPGYFRHLRDTSGVNHRRRYRVHAAFGRGCLLDPQTPCFRRRFCRYSYFPDPVADNSPLSVALGLRWSNVSTYATSG